MARVQLALNVADLDEAVAFYSKLFDTEPAKRHDGYANFAVADPPLKLVLFQGSGEPGTINHLGVEVDDATGVDATERRLRGEDLALQEERSTECCYALQDKVWVDAPDALRWEVYTVLADVEEASPATCCG